MLSKNVENGKITLHDVNDLRRHTALHSHFAYLSYFFQCRHEFALRLIQVTNAGVACGERRHT